MTRKRVRMVDVARAAGVSETTASFVLNGRNASIPVETRERVLHAARQMGYMPHAGARALATGRTHRIGIVLIQPERFLGVMTYYNEILAGVTAGTLRHDYNLLLHSAHYPSVESLQQDILSGGTDGTLLVGRYDDDPLTPALLNAGFPTVCISYNLDHPACYAVDCDNEAGARLAVQHLIALGHKDILFFHPGEPGSWNRERYFGAMQALCEAGFSADNLRHYTNPEDERDERAIADGLVSHLKSVHPRPTALISAEEPCMRLLVERLPDVGIRVPDDLAVVSFNSTEVSSRAHPPITSVWQPLREIGAAAVDMLVDRIEQREVGERIRRFPMRLDVRESTVVMAG